MPDDICWNGRPVIPFGRRLLIALTFDGWSWSALLAADQSSAITARQGPRMVRCHCTGPRKLDWKIQFQLEGAVVCVCVRAGTRVRITPKE